MPFINDLYCRFRHSFAARSPRLYSICDRRKGIIKFFIAGGLAGGSDLILLFVFHGLLGWGIVFSTSAAFILSFLISFNLQKFWTFRNYGRDRMAGQLFLYILNAVIGLNINGALMHLLVNSWSVWYLLAQVIVNLGLGAWNFLIYKFIIFKVRPNEIDCQQKTA